MAMISWAQFFEEQKKKPVARPGSGFSIVTPDNQPLRQQPKPKAPLSTVANTRNLMAKIQTDFDAGFGEQATKAFEGFQVLRDTPGSVFYAPNIKPTNIAPLQMLQSVGVDVSQVDANWIQNNVGLMAGAKMSRDGTPTAPTKKSTPAEIAGYAYYKLAQDEPNTVKSETEWADLQNELSYWAQRTDRNYSDDEIIAKIDWKKYPTLKALDDAKALGKPLMLNRGLEYGEDALYGTIWAARNGFPEGTVMQHATNYALGEGEQYKADPLKIDRRNPQNSKYNPYLLGSTLDEETAFFGVSHFTPDWLAENTGAIRQSGDETANKMLDNVWNAEERTSKIEKELADISKSKFTVDAMAKSALAFGMTADEYLEDYFSSDYAEVGKIVQSLKHKSTVGVTRAIGFDYTALRDELEKTIRTKKLEKENPAAAADQRKQDVLAKDGDLTQPETVPPSSKGWDWVGDAFGKGATWLKNFGESTPIISNLGETEETTEGKPGAKAPQSLGQWAGVSTSDAPRGRPLAEQIKEVENERTAALIELQTLTGDAYDKKQDEIDGIDAKYDALEKQKREQDSLKAETVRTVKLEAERPKYAFDVPEGFVPEDKGLMGYHRQEIKNAGEGALFEEVVQREGSMVRSDYLGYAMFIEPKDLDKYYYLQSKSQKDADEFLNFIKADYLDEKVKTELNKQHEGYAKEHPIMASAQTLLLNMFSLPVEELVLIYDKIVGNEDVTKNSPKLYATRMSGDIRSAVSEDMSTLGSFAYGTLMSIADNLGGRALFGPKALLNMGFRVAASTMQGALDKGATADQAYVLAFVSMGAEMITEKAQFERFTEIIKTSKGTGAKELLYNFFMGGLKNAVPEGLEEVASGLANMAADIMVLGDKSAVMQSFYANKQLFEEQGFGPDESEHRAWVETAKSQGYESLLEFAGGAASGAFFNALGIVSGKFNSDANQKAAIGTSESLHTETDADNRQTQAVQLTAQALGTKLDEETAKKYEVQVMQELGIGPVDGLAQAVGVKGGFFDVLDALMNKVKKPARVIQAYLKNGGDPVVTAKVNALLQAFGAEDAKVDAMVGEALLKDVQTKAETDLNYANKRWGQKGLLYINNLVESGREGIREAVGMLQAMPSYAQSVVVAETNMQRLNVSQTDINAQMAAFAADLNMPEIAMNTAQRVEAQAVESRAREIYTGIDPNKAAHLQTAQDTLSQTTQDLEVAQQMQAEASDEAAAIVEQANTNPTAEATKEAEKAMDRLAQAEEQAEHIRVQQERAQQEVQKAQQELEQQQAEDMEAARALAQEEYEQAKLTREQDMANTGSPDEARVNETPVKKPRNQYAELRGNLQNAKTVLYRLREKLSRQKQGIEEWNGSDQTEPVTADTLAKATQEYNDAATKYQNAEKLFNEFKGDKNNAELVSLYDDYDKKAKDFQNAKSKLRATEFSEGTRTYGERARAMESAQRSLEYAKKRIDDYLAKNQIKADEPANTRQQDMANTGSPDEARLAEINVEEQADLLVNENLPEGTPEEKESLRSKYIAALNRKLGRYKQVAFSEKAQDFISKVAQKYQVTIEADEAVQGAEEAYYDPKTNSIHLNPNATQGDALIGIAMHELTHAAEVSEWYGDYSKAVLSIMYGDTADNADFERAVQAKIDRYARDGKILSYDDAVKEIVAQGTRQVIFDEASINKLVQTDVKLARKLLDALNRVINGLKSVFMGSENAELEKARDLFEKALVSRIDQENFAARSNDTVASTEDAKSKYDNAKAIYDKAKQTFDTLLEKSPLNNVNQLEADKNQVNIDNAREAFETSDVALYEAEMAYAEEKHQAEYDDYANAAKKDNRLSGLMEVIDNSGGGTLREHYADIDKAKAEFRLAQDIIKKNPKITQNELHDQLSVIEDNLTLAQGAEEEAIRQRELRHRQRGIDDPNDPLQVQVYKDEKESKYTSNRIMDLETELRHIMYGKPFPNAFDTTSDGRKRYRELIQGKLKPFKLTDSDKSKVESINKELSLLTERNKKANQSIQEYKKLQIAQELAKEKAENEITPGQISYESLSGIEEHYSSLKFSLRETVEETKDLVAVHNIKQQELIQSLKLGGFPMPSIAITKADMGHDKFGEISVVFGKDTIDPQANKGNDVYSQDAWTPSFPDQSYKISEDKAGEINRAISNAVEGQSLSVKELEAGINRENGDAFKAFKDYAVLQDAYLRSIGIKVETTEENYNMDVNNRFNRSEDSAKIKAGYRAWFDGLFNGIVEKSGIRNSKKETTIFGNKKTFEQLHEELTLKNIVKKMKSQNGSIDGIYQHVKSAVGTKYKTIDDIKRDAKRLMQSDDFQKTVQNAEQRIEDLTIDMAREMASSDDYVDIADGVFGVRPLVLNAARLGYETAEKIENYIAREIKKQNIQAKITPEIASGLADAFAEARNAPTKYFEAKPQRAVGLNEVKTVILPDTASKELIDALDKRNIQHIEYKTGDNASRLEALNSDGIKGLRFSLSDETDSTGKSLTQEQAEYFKDSKVRDNRGNLLTMYHGTPYGGFTVFKEDSNFTDSKTYAERYQNPSASSVRGKYDSATNPTTYEVYLDIKKPFDTREPATLKIFNGEFYENWSRTPLSESGLPDWTTARDLSEFIAETGLDYDGLIVDEGGDGGYGEEVSKRGLAYIPFSPSQIKSIDNQSPTTNPDIRYPLSDDDIDAQIDSLLSRYGAIPQGEKPTNLDQIPAKTGEGQKVRKFARTVSESGVYTPEEQTVFKQDLVDGKLSYEPISDQKAIDYAERLSPDGLQQEWTQAQSEKSFPGKMQVAVGERLLMDYAKAGDVDNTMKLTSELAEVMTRAGQTVQAARLLKKMTNAGQLYDLQRQINRINRNNPNANVELNPALVDDLLKAKTDQERGKAVEALSKDAGQQLPPSWKTRLNAWRYFAMLGNPRTHIRNLVGNAVFMPAVKIKNMTGAAIEKVTGSEKTKSIVINRTLLNAAMEDAKIHARELQSGGKYNPQNAIEQNRKSFGDSKGGKTLEALAQANLNALEWEDGIFLRRHYANALAGYLQANKLTFESADEKTMAKARSYAVEEAKKATYRDSSELADRLSRMSKKGGIAGLVIEGVLPFKKTPINILKRGIEYSPIGLLETITRGTKQLNKGTITQAQYIDKIAAGMTGTMIAGLGAFLSSIGAIKVGFKDDKEDEFRRLTGHQEYAIEIFGKSITLDWMVPSAMPLFVGATLNEMFEQGIDPENAFKETLGALSNIMEPAFNLTMLDGVSRAVQSASWSENNSITEMLITAGTNFAGQFVPTLGGQIARTIDPVRRKSYTDKNSPLPNSIQRMIGTARNKIPGLAQKSEPYLDVWGREERENSPWLRAFENFLSPAYINDLTPDAVETLLTEVYKQTGDGSVLPGTASKYFDVNGERIDLTGPQYTKYTKDRGQAMYGTMEELLSNTDFQALEPRLKAKALAGAIEYANGIGKLNISKDYIADTWIKEAKKRGNPGASIIDRIKEAEREDTRAGYRMESISAMTTGDEDSLEAMYGALSEWYREKDPTATPKQITSSVTNYLSNAVKTEYLAAYEADDDDQMELIENTLASLGIRYKYRDWVK